MTLKILKEIDFQIIFGLYWDLLAKALDFWKLIGYKEKIGVLYET